MHRPDVLHENFVTFRKNFDYFAKYLKMFKYFAINHKSFEMSPKYLMQFFEVCLSLDDGREGTPRAHRGLAEGQGPV